MLVLTAAGAQPGEVAVELNRLDNRDNGNCRAYMVFENGSDQHFSVFQLDLVLFDGDGIIEQRLAVEAGPLDAGKTVVKLFDIEGLGCDRIGRILLNAVIECRTENGPAEGCTRRTRVSARTETPFFK
ncbi:hypothetical protein DEM34_09400 [Spiribacter halobius]|uniref:Tat pathway signal sequence domain protein n=1 Tax=Sediminicurvatus halobius TaxID=2182432 RepID=A0A2U2N2T1_9GAMM|nr:hypothetical protein DEM34_09400 [Spiribacter halobius]